ncbi:MAG: N-acetylmuramoyl-L-alanine amidase family protein [Promethearchaeota archaeon]
MGKAKENSKRLADQHLLPVFLLDPGHGGIIDGVYQTSGKRSPKWSDGRQLFEGEFNRAIVERLMKLMDEHGFVYRNIVPELEDVELWDRTENRADSYHDTINEHCIYLSIHANAGGGTGFEVFTTPGQTKSDTYAEIWIEEYAKEFPELRLRDDESDGDHDKEARFWVLTKTKMPSILIECGFMDTLKPDCELLMSEKGRDRMAKAIFNGMKRIVDEY